MKHIIDTHALLWYLADSPRLSTAADAVLQEPTSVIVLPATAYAEACWIVERGRVPALTVADVRAAIDADPRISIHPLDRGVIDRSQGLTAINEMHDRQIVATALVLADEGEMVTRLTHDGNITASGLVPVVWEAAETHPAGQEQA